MLFIKNFFIMNMDRANNRYVPKLLLSYVYLLDIRARLMRALESTTSCKRILISRAPMCRKRKFDLHLSVFKD